MARNSSSISNASSLEKIAEYWDTHDLADHWDETYEVYFEVSLERTAGRNHHDGEDLPPSS